MILGSWHTNSPSQTKRKTLCHPFLCFLLSSVTILKILWEANALGTPWHSSFQHKLKALASKHLRPHGGGRGGDFSWASVPGEVGKAGGVNLPPDFLSLRGTLRKGAFPLSNCFVGIWSLEPSPPQGSAQQMSTPVEFLNMFC